jgi:hypothetical protein
MRKCLNVLQACHLAYSTINEKNVYLCTGNPLPADIEIILDRCMNTDLQATYECKTKYHMHIEMLYFHIPFISVYIHFIEFIFLIVIFVYISMFVYCCE